MDSSKLLIVGGVVLGGFYLLNKNKKDKENAQILVLQNTQPQSAILSQLEVESKPNGKAIVTSKEATVYATKTIAEVNSLMVKYPPLTMNQFIDNYNKVYNTNLTELKFKKENVIDLWKHFPQVCVAASLDDMGERAAVIRSGTDWKQVEQNIRDIKRECPHIDFMISPTLSMMNIWNFVKFHRYMIDQGFIQPKDFNLNILQGPRGYRIDVLPMDIKLKFKAEFEEHIEWLKSRDTLQRATGGFEGAVKFMVETDNSHLLGEFWNQVCDLDWSRKESLISVVPELEQILQYKPAGTRI
jgi:hypothetical protein